MGIPCSKMPTSPNHQRTQTGLFQRRNRQVQQEAISSAHPHEETSSTLPSPYAHPPLPNALPSEHEQMPELHLMPEGNRAERTGRCPFMRTHSSEELFDFPITDHPVIDVKLSLIAEKSASGWQCLVRGPVEGKMAKEIFGHYAETYGMFPLEEIIPLSSRLQHKDWTDKIFNEGFITESGDLHHLWDSLRERKKDPERYVYVLSPVTGAEIPVHILLHPHQKEKSDRYTITVLMRDLRPKKWVNDLIQNTLLTFHNLKNGPISAIDLLTPVSNIMLLHNSKKQNVLGQLVEEESREKREALRAQLEALDQEHTKTIETIIQDASYALTHSLHLISPDIERQLRAISTGQNPYPGVARHAKETIAHFIADESKGNSAVYRELEGSLTTSQQMQQLYSSTSSSVCPHAKQILLWCDPAVRTMTMANMMLESLLKALHNLIKNPFENGATALLIRVHLVDNGKQLKVEVIDNGKGLPMAQFKVLFDPQGAPQHTDSEQEKAPSAATSRNWHRGLSFCIENFKKLEREGCTFTATYAKHEEQQPHVHSAGAGDLSLEHGTCFEITLPVLESSPQEKKSAVCDARLVTQDQILSQQQKPKACILLVDDDPICLSLLLRKVVHDLKYTNVKAARDTAVEMSEKENSFPALRLSNDVHVYCAQNINDAFEIVKRNQPSLVISDFNMPGGNGKELIQKIRANEYEQKCTQPSLLVLHTDKVQFTSEQASFADCTVHHLEKGKALSSVETLHGFITEHSSTALFGE